MDKFISIMENKVMPVATRVGQNKFLRAVSHGMVSIIAIIIVASMATLVQSLDIKAYQDFLFTTTAGQYIWQTCQNIWWGCLGMYGIFVCTVSLYVLPLVNHYGKSMDTMVLKV